MSDNHQRSSAISDDIPVERFAELVKAIGGVASASRLAGVTRSTIYDWTSGRTKVPFASVVIMARAAGMSLDWLAGDEAKSVVEMGGFGPPMTLAQVAIGPAMAATPALKRLMKHLDKSAPQRAGFVEVPYLDIQASAGVGRLAMGGDAERIMMLSESWLRTLGIVPRNAQLLSAVGDSMEPTIRDGDLLLVDRGITNVMDNGIYIVVVGGLVLVKRLQMRVDKSLTLLSDNRERYDPETIGPDRVDELTIEGRVKWYGRSI